MKRLITRTFSILFFLIFFGAIFSLLFPIYKGNNDSQLLLFSKMLLNPALIVSNPVGALDIFLGALVQFCIVYLFYTIGRRLWMASENKNNNST